MVVVLIIVILALLVFTGAWAAVLDRISPLFPEGFWAAWWADILENPFFYGLTILSSVLLGLLLGAVGGKR